MNGHIGFNEPGSPFDSPARAVDLAESTVGANATVHRRAATLGLATIMASKKILLLAKANKAAIVETLVTGPPSEALPASALWYHPNVEILIES
jgi:glucosamine-6-phosphate deaminase